MNQKPSKGFGDTISKVTHALGIPECENCAWRREKLNELFPYKQADDKKSCGKDEQVG